MFGWRRDAEDAGGDAFVDRWHGHEGGKCLLDGGDVEDVAGEVVVDVSEEDELLVAPGVMGGVEGISFVHFTEKDVVRHPMVQKIVTAYDRFERAAAEEGEVRLGPRA